jgi:signal transduction histidine kinase
LVAPPDLPHDDAPRVGVARVDTAQREAVRAEPARVAVVQATRLLDAPSEPAFDRVTRLAARLLRTPAAFVSLVDAHRDFYVSTVGLSEPLASARVLTGETFCHHALATGPAGTPLVIPDTTADAAYRNVPTVRDLGVAAYVGVPLIVGGHPVGALCVIDTVPRSWTADEVEVLQELASSARREIELRIAATDAERREAALEARTREAEHARARIEAMLGSISDAFLALDREWRFTYLNDRAEQMLQRSRAELLGRCLWEEFPLAVGTTFEREYRRAVDGGTVVAFEAYYPPPLDTWYEVRAYPGPEGLAVYFQDVNERRQAAEALAESEARFRTVQEASPNGFLTMRPVRDATGEIGDFTYTYVNPAGARILGGRRPEQLVGQRLLALFPGVAEDGLIARYARVADTGDPYSGEFLYRHEELDVGFRITAVRVGTDVAIAYSDETPRLHAEAERERLLAAERAARATAEAAQRDAERANRARADFLAVMSHELRTPLNAIGGYTELLQLELRGPLTEAQHDDLARIQRSQRHLLGLVNEVLNYAKLEAGRVRYDLADVPVYGAIREAEGLVAPQARAKGLTLTTGECPPTLAVRADAEKLRQVLVNLLSNAVKFTERGGARIVVECAPDTPVVAVHVRDTGIGIPADKLESIFEPFVQVRAGLTRPAEGTGLGLAISRDLARGMGGDLTAESTPGVGSTFTLTLPQG